MQKGIRTAGILASIAFGLSRIIANHSFSLQTLAAPDACYANLVLVRLKADPKMVVP
jgi:hypothetical protein